jgi:hypothetical protein
MWSAYLTSSVISSEFLETKPRLVHPAGSGAFQIAPDLREEAEHGKTLQREDDRGAGAPLGLVQDFQIPFQKPGVHHVAGGGNCVEVQVHVVPGLSR